MPSLLEKREHCPDCGVGVGERHIPGCDTEQCPTCGLQRIGCDCMKVKYPDIPWDGYGSGVLECHEYNLFAKLVPGQGWIPCSEKDSEVTEDLNRLYQLGRWKPELQKWVFIP